MKLKSMLYTDGYIKTPDGHLDVVKNKITGRLSYPMENSATKKITDELILKYGDTFKPKD